MRRLHDEKGKLDRSLRCTWIGVNRQGWDVTSAISGEMVGNREMFIPNFWHCHPSVCVFTPAVCAAQLRSVAKVTKQVARHVKLGTETNNICSLFSKYLCLYGLSYFTVLRQQQQLTLMYRPLSKEIKRLPKTHPNKDKSAGQSSFSFSRWKNNLLLALWFSLYELQRVISCNLVWLLQLSQDDVLEARVSSSPAPCRTARPCHTDPV